MVVIAAFAIIVSLIGGFYTIKDQPKSEISLATGAGGAVGRSRIDVKPASEIEEDHFIKQKFDFSCGSAALATLLRFYLGEELTEKQVIQGLLKYGDAEQISKRRAFSLLDMKMFVKALGYEGEGYKVDLEELKTLGKPCIVRIKIYEYNHFSILKGVYKGHVFLTDPWRGDISFTVDEFEDMWFDKIIFMVSKEGVNGLRALRLKEEDLRFIDEDAARRIIFDRTPPATNREQRLINDVPGKYQYYGK
ncbi:MAG: C39 family peptidase [Geobacteraceae bacterium]